MASRRSILITAAALITSGTAALVPSTPAAAASFTMTVDAPVIGGIGVDAVYTGGSGGAAYDIPPCTHSGDGDLNWTSSGSLDGPTSVPNSKPGLGTLTKIRFEFYPGDCAEERDMYTSNVGGVHFEAPVSVTNYGTIRLPTLGNHGVFRIDGDIISSTPITEERVNVSTFQVSTSYPNPPRPLQTNGSVSYGTFASHPNKGDQWTAGPGWGGRYIMFIHDRTTGRKATVHTDIFDGAVPTIDLDAVCFGFDLCTHAPDAPPPVRGDFYPMTPTRILDTRIDLGIEGPVRTGDGRHSDPNPIVRAREAENHEVKVTGRFGIPEAGVSAVLLNVTAVGAPGPGYLSLVPKPERVGSIYNDQASFGALPSTSNLNVDDGNAVPNMVLARVGAGGKIRIVNSLGPTHVIADIAGWFGTEGRYNDGSGFLGVVPARLMDSRSGIGGPQRRFASGETRELTVAGVAGVPSNAESVVLNITSVLPGSAGSYVTAWPKGESAPNASNVNGKMNAARANLAVVKVGANGKIKLRTFGATDLIVDIMGSFGPYGGQVTAIEPQRSVDTRGGIGTEQRSLQSGEDRKFTLRGRAGVPSNATAVIVNITSVNSTNGGYFTAYPTGSAKPTVSNLNFGAGQNVPNLAMLKLGDDGAIRVFNAWGRAHVLIDVLGYVS